MWDKYSRRNFLATSVATAAATDCASAASGRLADKPNVLFILTDQWRFSAFGHGTDDGVRTPHIDQLAQEGAICERAYAANPVCTPNRSCLLTGRYSHQTGMITNNLMLPPDEVCWPQRFSDAGYQTHYIGKWHMDGVDKPGYVPPGWRRRGFQSFQGFNRGHEYHKAWGFNDDGSPLVPEDVASDPDYYEPTFQTDLAIDYMKRNHDKPFLCYLSLGPPHTPFRPPKKFDLYSPADITLRPNVPVRHRQQARKDLAGYYGLCESLDHEVGRLMQFLKTSGMADNTLVVFTSDHGELAGSHGKYRKGEPEEESLHVPLVIRMPQKVSAGTRVNGLVNSIDLMPTTLSLCGLDIPSTCAGRDVSVLLTGQGDATSQSAIYCEGKLNSPPTPLPRSNKKNRSAPAKSAASDRSWRTIVTDTHKLTVRGGKRTVEHLFDLANDPFEQHNLAASADHQSLVSQLTDQLMEFRNQTADSWPQMPKSAEKMYQQ